MNSTFCSLYDGSGSIWPTAAFPGNLFPFYPNSWRIQAQTAWNFFETVESADAATRVFWSARGGWVPPAPSAFPTAPSLWYPIVGQGALTLYRRGQSLHQQACPDVNWTSQRALGIPKTPVTNVYPGPLLI
jgi:hypothetical protein